MEMAGHLTDVAKAQIYQASKRGDEWIAFARKVFDHVEVYTVPQYGDAGQDQVTEWTPQQCVDAIKKYCARFGNNVRGPEDQLRDLLKIAHYACLAHSKLVAEQSVTNVGKRNDGRSHV
jgi:hypothetical protein